MGQTRNPLYEQYTPEASTAVVICLNGIRADPLVCTPFTNTIPKRGALIIERPSTYLLITCGFY